MARRRKERPPFSGGIAFGELIAIFQPGVEHLVEERERKRADLVVPGDADDDWEIDLDGRVATLARAQPQTPTPDAGAGNACAGDSSSADGGSAASGHPVEP